MSNLLDGLSKLAPSNTERVRNFLAKFDTPQTADDISALLAWHDPRTGARRTLDRLEVVAALVDLRNAGEVESSGLRYGSVFWRVVP